MNAQYLALKNRLRRGTSQTARITTAAEEMLRARPKRTMRLWVMIEGERYDTFVLGAHNPDDARERYVP